MPFASPGDELGVLSVMLGEKERMWAAGRLISGQKAEAENREKHFWVFQKCLIDPKVIIIIIIRSFKC